MKLAFVDHIFHKKTGSGDFLRALFAKDFEVIDFWIDPYNKTEPTAEDLNQCDYIFFFQRLLPITELKKINKPITWAQMYDSLNTDYFFWKNIKALGIKTLSFSKKVADLSRKYGVPTLELKYHVKPNVDLKATGKVFFFWDRGHIKFDEIKKIIKPEDVDAFIYLLRPDPNKESHFPSDQDLRDYKIEAIMEDFVDKEKYEYFLSLANIFIAPRKQEGIGMSFLEAIARGMVVIGYDDATMNEYIAGGLNGYLWDEYSRPIDFFNIDNIRLTSIECAEGGYSIWEEEKEKINPFIMSEVTATPNLFFDVLYKFKLKLFELRNGRL